MQSLAHLANSKHPVYGAQELIHRLDGLPAQSIGFNSDSMLNASNDIEALHEFLFTKCKKPTTHKAMTSAIRKLLVYMRLYDIPRLSDFKLLQCSHFQDWLQDKHGLLSQNKEILIYDSSVGGSPMFWLKKENRFNPAWRPFKKPMNEVTAQQTIDRIHTIFQWLCDANYLTGNPWKIADKITDKRRVKEIGSGDYKDKVSRELPFEVIQAVIHYLDHGRDFEDDARNLPPSEPVLPKLYPDVFARRRWIFYFYFYTAARVTSGTTATLDDIYLNDDHQPMLRLFVKGRGTKLHMVPWIEELEQEYYRYRAAINLPAERVVPLLDIPSIDQPIRHELGARHLILPQDLNTYEKSPKPLSYGAMAHQIEQLFIYVRRWVERHPELSLSDKQKRLIEQASGHWIRHGTAALLGESAKEQLGHSNIQTTASYQAAKRKAQRARLKSIGQESVDEDIFFQLLEADDETKRRWIEVLKDSLTGNALIS